ncbi:glycosyltransferase family 4 protein [Nesterenkonia sp. F]|uniref:glycosyltransferase family 4 protein n=1 Tax=Nesterenkonia sp. F TaxID=795955 RepID=UPI000255C7DE|nr:glycosyltransferase family 4 protein [Nesterenkonia sp. F]
MKIAYLLVDPEVGLFGTTGASVRVQEMIRAFQAHGHDVTVFCLTQQDRPEEGSGAAPGLKPADLRGLPVVTVPIEVPPSPVQPAEAEDGAPTGPVRAVSADARREAVGRAAAQLASRAVEEAVPFDLIYERCSMFSDAGARAKEQLAAAGHSAQLVMELDAPLVEERTDAKTSCWSPTVRALTAADLITCASSSLARWAGELLAGDGSDDPDERDERGAERGSDAAQAAAARIAVVPHGVNTDRFIPADRDPDAPFTIGLVGSLDPRHDIDLLLRALAEAPHPRRRDWMLEIIGGGPQMEQLQVRAVELDVYRQVTFHGPVRSSDMPQMLTRVDVAVAPFPAPQEGEGRPISPLTVYEHLACGVPVVASAVGDLPALLRGPASRQDASGDQPTHEPVDSAERISDADRGLLVPPGDVGALAAALGQLADQPDLRARMAFAGRAAVVERHTWTRRAGEVLRLLSLPSSTHVGLTTPIPVVDTSTAADTPDEAASPDPA